MKFKGIAAICIVLASLSAAAQMSHEEKAIRVAYARLAYATKMGVLLQEALAARVGRANRLSNPSELQAELDSQLDFVVENVSVGNLGDIQDRRWDSLVSKPELDLLSVALTYFHEPSKSGDAEMNYALAAWQRGSDGEHDWSMPVSEIMRTLPEDTGEPAGTYFRYATFTVTARLNGRQRTYQAIFLFGKRKDGSDAVYPIDHVLGMGTLNEVMQRSLYPAPLLETYMRELPGIRQWISTAAIPFSSATQDIACIGETVSCGIPANLIQKSLTVPIDPNVRKFYQGFRSGHGKTGKPTDDGKPRDAAVTPEASTCADYNQSWTLTQTAFGTYDHSGPTNANDHTVDQSFFQACYYTSGGTPNCSTEAEVSPTTDTSVHLDQGKTVTGYCHVVGLNGASGTGTATNGGASATGNMFGGSDQCASEACNCNITISASGVVTGTGKNIWSQTTPVPLTCNAVPDPTYTPPACTGNPGFVCSDGSGGGSLSPSCVDGQYSCNGTNECQLPPPSSTCNEYGEPSCGSSGWYCWDYQSPIIIDTTGSGFHLTTAANGVRFDLAGSGNLEQVAWTGLGSTNGWLALPRNGQVTSGKELFGNFTPQPASAQPNGFLALAVYDNPENGGNGDGVIDAHDAVWDKLRVWIDANHDGISQPDELHTLPSVGINSIALSYNEVEFTDQFGNRFRYKGTLNPEGQPSDDHVDRTIYDVFLSADIPGGATQGVPQAPQSEGLLADHRLR